MNVNPQARTALSAGSSGGGALRQFGFPGNDPEIQTGEELEFIFRLGDKYAVRATDPNDPRSVAPFIIPFGDVIEQRGGVTILNNVIDPTNRERTVLRYTLAEPGHLRVRVFSLDGALVDTVFSGPQGTGSYNLSWDGRNAQDDVVARGIYFVRITGPGIDEYRKVLVVK